MICSAPERGEVVCLAPKRGEVVCSAPEKKGVVCSAPERGEVVCPGQEKRSNYQGIELSSKYRKIKENQGSLKNKNTDVFEIFKTPKKRRKKC